MVKIGDFERVRFSICGCSHRDYGRMIPNLENFARLDRDRVPPGYAGGCFCARHEREFSALHSFYLLLLLLYCYCRISHFWCFVCSCISWCSSFSKRKKRVSIGIPKFYGKYEVIVSPLMKILNLNFVVAQRTFQKENECVSDSSLQLGLFEKFVASILSRLLSVNSGQIQMFLHLPVLVHCILMYFS